MDVGEYLHTEGPYGNTIDEGYNANKKQKQRSQAGNKAQRREKRADQPKTQKAYNLEKVYVIPHVYEEIPDKEYESLHRQKKNPNTASPSNPESKPALQDVQQPASYCTKSSRFWCLLSAALVIIILLIIVIVLFTPRTPNTAGPSAVSTDSENGGTTTSSSHGPGTSELPHTPETTKTPESLINATFLMNCTRLSEDVGSYLNGLCWMDEETLIVTSLHSKRLLKYTVNTEARSCHGEVIDSGYKAVDASCSADGRVYITEDQDTGAQVKIRIYDLQSNSSQAWYPGFSTGTWWVRIAVNDQFIVISVDSDNYVYNKDRVLQYKIHHTEVSRYFMRTYLTTDNVFFGTFHEGYNLLILNLLTNDTYISNDGVKKAYTVIGTRAGHVFVTNIQTFGRGPDIGMYSLNGTFLNYIQIEFPKETYLYGSAAVRNNDGKTFIAYSDYNNRGPILIYSIHG